MMAALREWLTSVVVVAMLLAVAQTLLPEGSLRKIGSFTGGLILLVALTRPLLGTDLERLGVDMESCRREIAARQAELSEENRDALAAGIAKRTEAYISTQAEKQGAAVTARVETRTGEEGIPLPWSTELTGEPSPELAAWIAQELDIPEERQVWHEREDEN